MKKIRKLDPNDDFDQLDSDWDSYSDGDLPLPSITSADQRILKWREATRPPSSVRSSNIRPRQRKLLRVRGAEPSKCCITTGTAAVGCISPAHHSSQQPHFTNSFLAEPRLLSSVKSNNHVIGSLVTEIVRRLFAIVKAPVQWLLTLWLMCLIVSYLYVHWTGLVQRAIGPICLIPAIQASGICSAEFLTKTRPAPDYPKLMELQGSLENLLERAVGGSTLAFDLKQSEMAVKDLKSLVSLSQLMCRERLAAKLDDFVSSARSAGRDLQRLGSRVGGSVDGVLAVNDYALRAIEAAKDAQKRSILASALLPWNTPSHSEISEIFITSMSVLEENLRSLVTEAQVAVVGLDNLEMQLATIHEITSREQSLVGTKRETLLRDLWTMLGANKEKMKQFSNHINLLESISSYRKQALAHVAATLVQLQQLTHDLQELRDRVSRPSLLADRNEIPLEVHILSIRKGIERLDAGRLRTRELEADALRRMIGTPSVEFVH